MACCPNCGKKLHIYNWKQNCPHCGVNLVYYNSNEILLEESEKAEIEHALFQPKVDRAKASTIGSPITWVRLVLSVLVLAAFLLVPFVKVNFHLPIAGEINKTMNGINIFNYITSINFSNFLSMFDSELLKYSFIFLAASLISLALSAVWIFISLIALVASLGPKGKIRNIFNHSFQIFLTIISAVFFNLFSSNISLILPFKGKLCWGIIVYIIFFVLMLGIDIITAIKGLTVKITPCLIGGLPSDEYFKMVENGVSEIEIRKKMVDVLSIMQNEFRARDAEAREKAKAEEEERRNRRKK